MEVEPDTNLKQYQVCESGFCMNKKKIWSVCHKKKTQGNVPGENVPK